MNFDQSFVDFWDERRELAHICDFARSRRANPLSTLAVSLVYATCQIPPWVVLPPIIGGPVAVNLYAALVATSGGGKGASHSAGRECIRYVVEEPGLPEFSPGSGEGIARTLMDNRTALFVASEIDTLSALFSRRGQTLEAELRKMYMGESLGFANANKTTRTLVPALSYRAGLIVGVQPLRAKALLNGADGGTPQRFLWMPTRDPEMPDERPDPIEPLDIVPSYWQQRGDALHFLEVCGVAREEIDRHHVDLHHGEPGIDPLDGHALLTRLKVACGLMVLAGHSDVSEEDWDLARRIMFVSKLARDGIQRAAEQQRRMQQIAKAVDATQHDEYLSDSKVRRAKRGLLRWLEKLPEGESISHSILRRKLKANVRDEFDPAIAELIDEGEVAEVKLTRGVGYVRVHGTPLVHPDSPAETKGVPTVYRVPDSSEINGTSCGNDDDGLFPASMASGAVNATESPDSGQQQTHQAVTETGAEQCTKCRQQLHSPESIKRGHCEECHLLANEMQLLLTTNGSDR